MFRRSLLALGALVALGTGCNEPLPPIGGAMSTVAVHVPRVVLVSVDGLRGDALARMPQLRALADGAAWTDSLHTVVPSLTVPGHLSMLSGRDMTTWGIASNTLDSAAAMRVVFSGMTTIFEWARSAGLRAEAVAGASLISPDLVSGAQQFFGVDTLIATSLDGADIARTAVARYQGATAPSLLFVHFPDVDLAGHASGWIVPGVQSAAGTDSLGTRYLAAAQHVDSAIARLHAAMADDIAAGRAALVVTADHGGGHGEGCTAGVPAYREHCSSNPGDVLVPFVLVARDQPAGRMPTGAVITQVGPTVAAMLQLTVPTQAAGSLRVQ